MQASVDKNLIIENDLMEQYNQSRKSLVFSEQIKGRGCIFLKHFER